MHVAIRPVVIADRLAFVDAVRRSRRLHSPWTAPPRDAAAFRHYLTRFDGVHSLGFVVVESTTGGLAGAINLTNIVYGAFRSGYLGYFAFTGYEGRGYMSGALRAVVKHAFCSLKLHRVEANIQPDNDASLALVRACGFQYEGFSPAYLKVGGRWRDHERWALVRARPGPTISCAQSER